ncbi:peptidoglycan DD-metalloendopeptidase family protein [bacterium]|nr:peptidoglycan DD-metalloendopeptidase family protein [bacterium]
MAICTFMVLFTAFARPIFRKAGTVVMDHAAGLDQSAAGDSIDMPPAALVPAVDGDSIAGLQPLPETVIEDDLVIGRNQTFYEAMRQRGASHGDIMALVEACRPYRNLRKVRRGHTFRVAIDDSGRVYRMRFDLEDEESYIAFQRKPEGGYLIHELTYPVEHRVCAVAGIVADSVYESLKGHGAPPALAAKMNDILGWEVDFRRDVRQGDSYRIIYEEIHRDGAFVRTGPILAVEYTNRGETHRGFRFAADEERPAYFDGAGRSLEKQLMRAPLEYSRISDGFTQRRFHPVHKRYMPHYGVDYAAPVGTPVRAAGDGVVVEARYNKNNGRYVKIQHSNQSYETYYLHLSRYAKGVKKGVKVSQGQVIGYVGASGVATGPHLDYRVKKDGRWVNPRRLKLPASAPVPADRMARFNDQVALYSYCLGAQPSSCAPREVIATLPLQAPFEEALATSAAVPLMLSSRMAP